jgi:hypothetical protein
VTDAARIRELMLGNLFAVFNERDPGRRSTAIAANYTDDVIWTDPDGTTQGRQALNEQAQKLLDRFPQFVFSAGGPVHVSRDLGLLAFPPGSAGATAGGQRHRRCARARWADLPPVYDPDGRELTSGSFQQVRKGTA